MIRRDKKVVLRFTHDELDEIDIRVPEGTERAKWLRELALGQQIQISKDKLEQDRKRKVAPPIINKVDPELVREVSRIGNNLNQIAHAINIFKRDTDVIQVLKTLVAIENDLSKIIELPEKQNESKNI